MTDQEQFAICQKRGHVEAQSLHSANMADHPNHPLYCRFCGAWFRESFVRKQEVWPGSIPAPQAEP